MKLIDKTPKQNYELEFSSMHESNFFQVQGLTYLYYYCKENKLVINLTDDRTYTRYGFYEMFNHEDSLKITSVQLNKVEYTKLPCQ